MHPLRYVAVVNYESFLNNERKAHIIGFFAEIEAAQNAINNDIDARRRYAKEDGNEVYEGRNTLTVSDIECFTYDIHDLCAKDWSCEACA